MAARKQDLKPTRRATNAQSKRPNTRATPATTAKSKRTAPAKSSTKRKAKGGLAAHQQALAELRAFGLAFPEAHTKSPWPGHLDLAVRDKTFAYLNHDGEPLTISCKLPHSCHEALGLGFTTPTGYGLGKSGWVTATFVAADVPPVEFLKA